MLVLASPLGLLPSRASLALRVAGCPVRVSLPFCASRVLGPVAPRVRAACPLGVGALVLPWRTRLSPSGRYARFWCRAPVGPFQAVRAPPHFLPRSGAPPI